MGKVVIYGPEIPNIMALVHANKIFVEDARGTGYILDESVGFGVTKNYTGVDIKTYLTDSVGFGVTKNYTGDIKTYLTESIQFTNV